MTRAAPLATARLPLARTGVDEIWPHRLGGFKHIGVVLVDAQTLVRAGLRALLAHQPDIRVIADAGVGEELLAAVAGIEPSAGVDVVVMDLSFPGTPGIDELVAVRGQWPDAALLVLTAQPTDRHICGAVSAGASGYVVKDAPPGLFLDAIRATARGDHYWDPRLSERILASCRRRWDPDEGTAALGISKHERRFLALIAMGMSNRDIATELNRNIKAIEASRSRLLRRLGLCNAATVARFAIRHGLVSDRPLPLRSVPRAAGPAPSGA